MAGRLLLVAAGRAEVVGSKRLAGIGHSVLGEGTSLVLVAECWE